MTFTMRTSAEIGDIAKALSAAQGEIKNPAKDKINPHFKSKYADLAAGFDAVRPVLAKHGLSILQATEIHDGSVVLCTRLMHGNQWIDSFYPVSQIAQHQAMGAAMTYAKRQAMFAMIGIVGDDDDDGNTAAEPMPIKPQKQYVETVVDRLISVISKQESAVELGEWWSNPKVADAFRSLSISDKARVETAKRRRLEALAGDGGFPGDDPLQDAA